MKTLILTCLMLLCLNLMAQTPLPFTEGTGTVEDPVHIDNFGQLYYLTIFPSMWNLHYIQTADIDATESTLIPSDQGDDHGWLPIGRGSTQFTGSYNGQDFRILNLYMNRPTHEFNGLFGYIVGGKVQKVHLENATILGGHYAGVLSGVAHANSIISHCSATGTVSGTYNVGGLIGFSNDSTIMNSFAQVSTTGYDRVGGFIGTSGWQDSYTHISFCYSTGAVVSSSSVGGFSGWGGNSYHRECYWDVQSSGISTDAGSALGKTTAEMQQRSTYEFWNFTSMWSIQENLDYPQLLIPDDLTELNSISLDDLEGQGTPADPYLIYSVDELNAMRLDLSAHYALMADIDLESSAFWDYGRGWQPIGNAEERFTGSFNGNSHTIDKLTINRTNVGYLGLFGYTEAATIQNLKLQNFHIIGENYCGGISGYTLRGSLDKFEIDGIVLAKSLAGGITGVLDSGFLQRSYADMNVTCQTEYGGALVGVIYSTEAQKGIVSNCGSNGLIRGNVNMGGLVGALTWGYIINSYSHASVIANGQPGGIVGLCGWTNPGYVVRCFATGAIGPVGADFAGGVVGWLRNGVATECYWDLESSGISSGAPTGIAGKTTAEMMQRDTFGNWNFDSLWQIEEGIGYPSHQDLGDYTYPQALSPTDLLGMGTSEQPYLIHTADELNVMRQDLSASYRLANDIDLSASVIWNGGMGWEAVGNTDFPFVGNLDGDGFEITKLNLVFPIQDKLGLFGEIVEANVQDISLSKANLLAQNFIGGIAGVARLSSLSEINFQGYLSAKEHIGGMVGYSDRSTLNNSHANVSIISYGNNYTGGLVSYMIEDAVSEASIYSSSCTGKVIGNNFAGGLVGCVSSGRVIDSYSHALVRGYSCIGGAVGRLGYSGTGIIERCYATGYVDLLPGGWGARGLVGFIGSYSANSCYWDINSSGISSGSTTGIVGLSTAQMTYPGSLEQYLNWDFANTWRHDITAQQNGGYPYLAWEEQAIPGTVQNLTINNVLGELSLQWQPVTGVNQYHIYASNDPYAPLHQWEYIGVSSENSFDISANHTYRFYVVRSVGE